MDKKTKGLTYEEAMQALEEGKNVKLPEWTGFWFKNGSINVYTKTGDVLGTPDHEYHSIRNDWEITDGSLGFDFAILALKAGKKVSRDGWNGEGMYVFMVSGDTLSPKGIERETEIPLDIRRKLIKKGEDVNLLPYLCMYTATGEIVSGWLASQTDLLATDWGVVE